jgi:hypothetical protein
MQLGRRAKKNHVIKLFLCRPAFNNNNNNNGITLHNGCKRLFLVLVKTSFVTDFEDDFLHGWFGFLVLLDL